MLVQTAGRERPLAEYEALLKDAGFEGPVRGVRTGAYLDVVFAVKGGGQ